MYFPSNFLVLAPVFMIYVRVFYAIISVIIMMLMTIQYSLVQAIYYYTIQTQYHPLTTLNPRLLHRSRSI